MDSQSIQVLCLSKETFLFGLANSPPQSLTYLLEAIKHPKSTFGAWCPDTWFLTPRASAEESRVGTYLSTSDSRLIVLPFLSTSSDLAAISSWQLGSVSCSSAGSCSTSLRLIGLGVSTASGAWLVPGWFSLVLSLLLPIHVGLLWLIILSIRLCFVGASSQ